MNQRKTAPRFVEREPRVNAMVLFSGGIDSLVTLLAMREKYTHVMAVGFHYGQLHETELDVAEEICERLGVFYQVMRIPELGLLSEGGLVNRKAKLWDDLPTREMAGSLFVPGRNLVMMSYAAGLAVTHGASVLAVGEGQADGHLFPDAEREFFLAMEAAISAGVGQKFLVEMPLMGMTKGEGIAFGYELDRFAELLPLTISCYRGQRPGCGECPACTLRACGFSDIGVADPAFPARKLPTLIRS